MTGVGLKVLAESHPAIPSVAPLMMATSPLGSRIMSPITRGDGISSTTHDGFVSVILSRPHVLSAGGNCPAATAPLEVAGVPPQMSTSASVGLGFSGSSTDEPAFGLVL